MEDPVAYKNNNWLRPQIYFPGYGYYLFLCNTRQHGWFEIELSSDTKEKAWISEEDGFVFKEWGDFLTKPNANTPPIVFHKYAVVGAIGHEGNWLQVKERFDEMDPPEGHQIKWGWLKWRDENDFLIKYNLAY